MSLSRFFLLSLLVLPGPALAKTMSCPASYRGQTLAQVDLFDGPPAEMADLVPDRDFATKDGKTSVWNVHYVYEQSRSVYLQCQYGSGRIIINVHAKSPVHTCTYTEHKDGKKSLSCH